MDWIVWVLFESTLALGACLFFALFWLLVYWRRSGKARPLAIGAAVAVILLATQGVVITSREHAAAVLEPIERDVLASRVSALRTSLAGDFEAGGMNAKEFADFAQARLSSLRVEQLQRTGLKIVDSQEERFEVQATYYANLTGREGLGGPVTSVWMIRFELRNGRWQITHIGLPVINGQKFGRWEHLRR